MAPPGPRTYGLFPALTIFILIMLALALRAITLRSGVYAYVDRTPIRKPIVDFERELILRKSGMRKPSQDLELSALHAAVDEAIERELVAREARRRGLRATPELLRKRRSDLIERVSAWQPIGDLMRDTHVGEADLQAEIEKDALWWLVQQQMFEEIGTISEDRARRYYSENIEIFREPEGIHVMEIFIARRDSADEQEKARARAQAAREEAAAGADFQALSARVSEGPARVRGGDLGFVRKEILPPPMEAALQSMVDGQISDVIETRDGYHIMKVVGRRHYGYTPYEEIEQPLKYRMKMEELNRRFVRLVDRLRAGSQIVRYDIAR